MFASFDFPESFDYAKLLVALTAICSFFIRLVQELSPRKNREEIKLELEIFELLKKTGLEKERVAESVQRKLTELSIDHQSRFRGFTIGTAFFLGFGLWTVDIYRHNEQFSGWFIVTLFMALIGLSKMLGIGKATDGVEREAFLRIDLLGGNIFYIVLSLVVLSLVSLAVLFIKLDGFSYWYIVLVSLLLVALFGLNQLIRITRL
ncbi:MAG: hypothetical protein WA958_20125 [Tunicatimonas sp.]